MRYVGSKNRLAKDLIPIIQPYVDKKGYYLEPFVGGANLIDKIKCNNKYGSDINKYLIALLKKAQTNINDIPNFISEDEYIKVKNNKDKYEDWYVGLVGFCCTFGSKWFGGYGRGFKSDGITPRYQSEEAIRNLKNQSKNLKEIIFNCCSYKDINKDISNFVIYCDPPYQGTIKYANNNFDYDEFYNWCYDMAQNNIVLVSEYNISDNRFECIWSKDMNIMIDSNRTNGSKRTEKLYKLKEE